MSLIEKLAINAISSEKSAAEFSAAAHKHAAATRVCLITAGAIWFFWGWRLALIPLATAIFTAVQSFSAAMVAAKIKKLIQNPSVGKEYEIDDRVISIIKAYEKTLENHAPVPGCMADSGKLPYPKQEIKAALIAGLKASDDAPMKEYLKTAYVRLADWQEGAGEANQGIDCRNGEPDQSAEALAKARPGQSPGSEDWGPPALKEQEILKQELKDLGLWQ